VTHYELEAIKNNAKGTLGYGIMWLFLSILVSVIPFYTANGHFSFYIFAAATLVAGIYKIFVAIKLFKQL